jgi:hypothetical protein
MEQIKFAAGESPPGSFSREGAKSAKDQGNLREIRVFA